MSSDISFPDYIAIQNTLFEWAESYDTKDWERLKKVLAPSVSMDYSKLGGEFKENATPDEFADSVSALIGDPRIRTQHFLGAPRWTKLDNGTIEVEHQARVAHQRYAAEDLAEFVNHGHGHGTITHTFKQFDGVWKVVIYKPRVDWTEYDLTGTLNPSAA